MGKPPPEITYEQAVERLEAIVARIESGEAGLEESIALYEEGVALGKRCNEALARAQQRVDELSKDAADPARSAGAPGAEDR